MKKIGIISIVAAAVLFVGCGEKGSHQSETKSEAKQQVEKKVEKKEVKKSVEKVEEALPGTPAKKVETTASSVKEEAKSSVSEAVSSVASSQEGVVESVKKSVTQKVEEVKEEAGKKVEEVKAAAAAALPGAAGTAEEGAKEQAKEEAKEAVKKSSLDGAKLYAKCASCHGPKGDRKALGKSAPIAGMPKDEVLKKLKEYKEGKLNLYGMGPLMKGQVGSMSDEELEALADYISKLK